MIVPYREAIRKDANGGGSMGERVQVSMFLSWCHDDAKAKGTLLDALHLDGLAGLRVDWWEDSHVKISED